MTELTKGVIIVIAYKCDRCGNYYDNTDFKTDIEGFTINSFGNPIDLCDDCKKDLIEFVKGGDYLATKEI